MGKGRDGAFAHVWASQNDAFDIMSEYDSLPHYYCGTVLFQAEAEIVDLIAEHPDITTTDLSVLLRKTPSACSQIVRKLRAKGLVVQIRDEENNRRYHLRLTPSGAEVYEAHTAFTKECASRMDRALEAFSDTELELCARVQDAMNGAYEEDIKSAKGRARSAKNKRRGASR